MSSAHRTWALAGKAEVEADIREEIEAHLDAAVADRIAEGMHPDEARREALASFGDVERIIGACRTVKLEEHIMLQRALLALVAILSIAVVVQAYQLNASQARTNEALAEVRHDFAAAAERIEAALFFVEIPYNSPAPREEPKEPPVQDDFFVGAGASPASPASPGGHRAVWEPGLAPARRLEAVLALAAGGSSSVPALLSAAEDPDVFVRAAAVRALGSIAHPDARPVLEQLAKLDPEQMVRGEAGSALAKLHASAREAAPISEFLNEEFLGPAPALRWDPELPVAERFDAISELRKLGDSAVGPLIEAAGDPDVFVRMSAVRLLGELAHPDAKPILEDLSNLDPQATVREEAGEALKGYDG